MDHSSLPMSSRTPTRAPGRLPWPRAAAEVPPRPARTPARTSTRHIGGRPRPCA